LKETFDALDLTRWREVEVTGKTEYRVEESALKAVSRGGASIMLCTLKFHPDTYPWITWRWKVDAFPKGENLKTKGGSDAAARVYVYFNTKGLPWQKRNVDYVWSERLPVGTIIPSAYTKSSMIIVVISGREQLGKWHTVTRNIAEDYRQCFKGSRPPEVGAIGLMTDADNTKSSAAAEFDDVMITRERPDPSTVAPWVK
jgi:hypothetical protein